MNKNEHLAIALILNNLVFVDQTDRDYVIETFAEYFYVQDNNFNKEWFVKICKTGWGL